MQAMTQVKKPGHVAGLFSTNFLISLDGALPDVVTFL